LSAELLAMLAPRTVQMGRIPGGGLPELTAQDLAAALGMSGSDKLSAELLLTKYAQDSDTRNSLKIRWRMRVGDHALHQKWDRKPRGTVFALADLALFESLSAQRCPSCNGVAELLIGATVRQCPTCSGTGLPPTSDASVARALNLPLKDYQNRWRDRLAWARRELHRIEYEALIALDEALED
jgi:Zn finger protein HypA/HybF involved in hydrogenase expression